MKKLKLKKSVIFSLILIITSILLIFAVFKIGILGMKYIIPIILVISLIDFLLLFFTNKKYTYKNKKKLEGKDLVDAKVEYEKKVKRKRKLLSFITIIVSILYLALFFILLNIYNSMNNLFKNESTISYSVIVNKSSKYKKINDLKDKIVGYYEEDKYNESAQKKLNKEVKVEYIGYSSIEELKEALLSEEIDSIMIMDSYLKIKEDNEELETIDSEEDQKKEDTTKSEETSKTDEFDSKTKVIYTFKIKIDNSKKTKSIDLEKGSFVVYVSGEDSYSNEVNETSRSDVNLLMIVNIKKKNVLLLSIPRDYYIKIDSKGAYDKLTHISLYGSEEAAKSIGAILDVDVDYFVKFNFTTFMKATEYLLPLDVYSDYTFTTSVYDRTIGDCYTFYEGYNHITNGKQALQFVRARKNFNQGDRQRGINQSRFLRAVINKASTPSVLLKYNKILSSLEGTFLTNIDNESIINIIKYVLNHNGKFNVYSMSLDGSDAMRSTYSGGSQALYVMLPNEETIEKAKVAIKAVLDGEKPDIEKDASELANPKDVHDVTKATTNYGNTSNTTKVIKPSPSPTPEVKKEEKQDEDEKTDDPTEKVDPTDSGGSTGGETDGDSGSGDSGDTPSTGGNEDPPGGDSTGVQE